MRNEFLSKRKKRREEMRELKELTDKSPFEKKDMLALILAALTTLLPFAVVIFLLLYFIPMLVMRWL